MDHRGDFDLAHQVARPQAEGWPVPVRLFIA